MIKINLLGDTLSQAASKKPEKAELAQVYGQEDRPASFPIAGLIVGLVFASFGGIYYISLTGKVQAETRRRDELEKQKQELQKYIQLEKTFRQQKDALQKKKEVMVGLRVSQRLPVHLLEELANCLPDDVWFKEISQKGKIITIKGESSSFEAINLFQTHLAEQKTWFQNVNYPGAGKKGTIFEFTISFDLKTPAA